MKQAIPYIVIGILLLILWQGGCEREERIVKVPEVVKEFDTITEIQYLPSDTVYLTRWESVEIETQNPVNAELVEQYQQAKDSIARLTMYLNAIQERNFSETFDDEFATVQVSGRVRGELLSLSGGYTLKEREVSIREGKRFRLLGGFNIGNNTNLSQFSWKATTGLQNASGDIITLGYDSNEVIWLGYSFSLLSF